MTGCVRISYQPRAIAAMKCVLCVPTQSCIFLLQSTEYKNYPHLNTRLWCWFSSVRCEKTISWPCVKCFPPFTVIMKQLRVRRWCRRFSFPVQRQVPRRSGFLPAVCLLVLVGKSVVNFLSTHAGQIYAAYFDHQFRVSVHTFRAGGRRSLCDTRRRWKLQAYGPEAGTALLPRTAWCAILLLFAPGHIVVPWSPLKPEGIAV